jgi:hypothetical protein
METIWVINTLLGFIGVGLSIAVGNLYTQLRDIRSELATLHTVYAKKDDVNRDFRTIQETLQRIEDKLDKKADR